MTLSQRLRPFFHLIVGLVGGFVLGAIFISYVFYLFIYKTGKTSELGQPPRIETELTAEQVAKATALAPGRQIFGVVRSQTGDSLEIEMKVSNPLDPAKSVMSTVSVPFDAKKDKVVTLRQVQSEQGASTFKNSSGSFADLKKGQQVLVSVQSEGKTIYLPLPQ